ncbi:MAG: glycoside hydrolase family 99-like domain-containing protein [Verrucomicrobiota bacterium]
MQSTHWAPCLSLLCGIIFLLSPDANLAQQAESKASEAQQPALVGAYYYPWYAAPSQPSDRGWMRQALRGRLTPQQAPALGTYSSRDPGVISEHIQQSQRAGLDFWAVSWWGPDKREDRALRDHILKHPQAKALRYAVLYESTGRLGKFENPQYDNLIPDFEYLSEHLFTDPQYLRIDGKPVVFIYLTRVYFRHQGEEALASLRSRFPELYLIGDEVFGPGYKAEYAKAWDAVTAYDVYGQSVQIEGATRKGVSRLLRQYRQASQAAQSVGAAFVPGIAPGYNDRAVRSGHPGRPRYFTDEPESREGDLFRSMIREVALPLLDEKAQRMFMITSFNEWYEDTQIEPTAGNQETSAVDDSQSGSFYTQSDRYPDYGNLYLDLLRSELDRAHPNAGLGDVPPPGNQP